MAESIVRGDTNGRRPVARVKLAQFSWTTAETAAVEKELPFNGIVKCHVAVVSANANNRTANVAIVDGDSYALYTSGELTTAATTTTVLSRDTEVYVPSGCSVKVTPSGVPGNNGTTGMTVDVTLYGVY